MKLTKIDRGFAVLEHETYPPSATGSPVRLLQQSSAIGDYDDSFDRPGSSYLWVGDDFHLNREQVAELVEHLQRWLKTRTLEPEAAK